MAQTEHKRFVSKLPILLVISFHRPILIAVRTVELNMLSYLSTIFSILIGLMSMRISERGVLSSPLKIEKHCIEVSKLIQKYIETKFKRMFLFKQNLLYDIIAYI
jgi:hypothetical protein